MKPAYRGRRGGNVLGSNSMSVRANNDWHLQTYNRRNDKGVDLRNDFRNKFVNSSRPNDRNGL